MSDTLDSKDNLIRDQVETRLNLNILDIPTDCSRLVFDRLTLNQLIHLRAVCHAWNHIITIICSHKRSLGLAFNEDLIVKYFNQTACSAVQDDVRFQLTKQICLEISPKIKVPNCGLKRTGDGSFSEQQNDPNLGIRFIARLFPNITNFVCMLHYDRLCELNYILWKWSTNLETLTIFVPNLSYYKISENVLQDTSQCFAQMSSLKRLHLFVNESKFFTPNRITFGRLEEFSFDSALLDLAPYFDQLDAKHCTFVRVGEHSMFSYSLNIGDANPELTSKLTHLAIDFCCPSSTVPNHLSKHLSRHFSKFQNLIHLEIMEVMYCSIPDALNTIVQVAKKLETLVLHLYEFDEMREILNYENNPNYASTFPIFHHTVSELHLKDINYKSYFDVLQCRDYRMLARTFPKVRKIRIYSNNLDKTSFDAQFRQRFSETFGERVVVTFYRVRKYGYYHFFGDD